MGSQLIGHKLFTKKIHNKNKSEKLVGLYENLERILKM